MITVLSVAIAAVPLGIACAAIDTAVELAQVKTPGLPSLHGSSLLLRDKPTFQAAVGQAEALLGSARSFLLATVGDLWDEVFSGVAASMKRRAMVRLASTLAAQSAAQAVDLMYNAGGTTQAPLAAARRRAVLAATIGNALDWYDFLIYGFLADDCEERTHIATALGWNVRCRRCRALRC